MLHCEDIRPDLSAYLDRELPGWKMQLIRWHLFRCSECAREVALLQQTDVMLKQFPEVTADEQLVEKILHQVGYVARHQEQSPGQRFWKYSTARIAWFRYVLKQKAPVYATVACILIGLGISMPHWRPHTKPAEPSETRVVQVELIRLDELNRGYVLY